MTFRYLNQHETSKGKAIITPNKKCFEVIMVQFLLSPGVHLSCGKRGVRLNCGNANIIGGRGRDSGLGVMRGREGRNAK